MNMRFLMLLFLVACTPAYAVMDGTRIPIETARAFPTLTSEELFWAELSALHNDTTNWLRELDYLRKNPRATDDTGFIAVFYAHLFSATRAIDFLTSYSEPLPTEINNYIDEFNNFLLTSNEMSGHINSFLSGCESAPFYECSSHETKPNEMSSIEILANDLLPQLDLLLELNPK